MNKQRFIILDEQRRTNAHAFMDSLPLDGKWRVLIEPVTKPRSPEQRNSFFGVAYPAIMKEQGDRGAQSAEELHEYFCGEYFGWVSYEVFGRKKVKPFRTTTRNEHGKKDVISTVVAADLYSFIQQAMADVGIFVPDPDPLHDRK